MKNTDSLPQSLSTNGGKNWQRRADLDDPRPAYEYGDGGVIGYATGRLTAAIPVPLAAAAQTWLRQQGFRTRVLNEGPEVALQIEHEEALRPLSRLSEISLVAGLNGVQAEIVMEKAHRHL